MLDSLTTVVVENQLSIMSLVAGTIWAAILGVMSSFIYMYRNSYNKNFVITLALLPVMVQGVIMLVNGNVGTGIAVMGAFSLVRFRSAPGNARDIGSIFLAMTIGLACSINEPLYALLILIVVGIMTFIFMNTNIFEPNSKVKFLKITLPENLNYTDVFDDIFQKYTSKCNMDSVRTKNMGSLYEIEYTVVFKESSLEKEFIDEIRCRNGNLPICCSRMANNKTEL